jgi:hypothetical protein
VDPDLAHCLAKIAELAAHADGSRRPVFQLGYNLGRLAELAQLGRGPCWDAWKEAVERWDRDELIQLAQELHLLISPRPTTPP